MHEATTFGALIRQRREEVGLSQEALAARANVSSGCIWNVEHGKVAPLRVTRIAILAALEAEKETSAVLSGARAQRRGGHRSETATPTLQTRG